MRKVCLLLFCALLITGSTVTAQKGLSKQSKKTEAIKQNLQAPEAPKVLPFELQILAEINLARQNPVEYAIHLEEWRKNYKGKTLYLPNRQALVTNEGTDVVDEAIAYLKSLKPFAAVSASNGLNLAALDHLQDMKKSGKTGHQGSDGSFPDVRIERYGAWSNGVSEIIKYGALTAREVVIAAILDDGVPERSHRKDLFGENFKLAGIAYGDGGKYKETCVIVMSGGLVEKPSSAGKSAKSGMHQF